MQDIPFVLRGQLRLRWGKGRLLLMKVRHAVDMLEIFGLGISAPVSRDGQ